MTLRYSLYQIEDQLVCPFSALEYSRFKYGETAYAEKFAAQLFEGFIKQHSDLILKQEEIVLFPSPYHSIPTASNFLCFYFKKNLNRFLFQNGMDACKEGKIHRKQTYTDDYGSMDYLQRVNLISNDTYYLDRAFIEGKFCIFLDDIRITGSHEHTVSKILEQYNVKGEFFFVYFAALTNPDIHPSIENYYNYFDVKTAADIVRVVNSDSFFFNTRIVKYILLMNDRDFTQIIQQIPEEKRNELLDLAISNNYHQIQEYQINITKLKQRKSWQLIYKKDKEKTLTPKSLLLA